MFIAVIWSKLKPEVEFQYGGRLGEFKWHVIPEPPATLQGAATWRIQWHVIPERRVTLQHVRIPSAVLKIVFRRILLFLKLLNAVWASTSGRFCIVSDTHSLTHCCA